MDNVKKLPVFKSAGEVYSGVTRHYFELAFSAPVAAIIYLVAMGYFLNFSNETTAMIEANKGLPAQQAMEAMVTAWMHDGVWPFLAGLVALLAGMSAAVRWHRFVLLGEHTGPIWNKLESRYLWATVKILLGICAFALLMMMLVGGAGMIIASAKKTNSDTAKLVAGILAFGGVTLVYIFLLMWIFRVSLALPDAATGGSLKVRSVYSKTSGNAWRILGYTLLVQLGAGILYAVATAIVHFLVKAVMSAAMPAAVESTKLVTLVLCLPLALYMAMIGVTMLSVAYREIIGLPAASGDVLP